MIIILLSTPSSFSLNAGAVNSEYARGEYSTQTEAPPLI
jgi:hypothetical protein